MERAFPRWMTVRCSDCEAPARHATPEDRVTALTEAVEALERAEVAVTRARGRMDPVGRRIRKEIPRLRREIAAEASLVTVDAEAY